MYAERKGRGGDRMNRMKKEEQEGDISRAHIKGTVWVCLVSSV